MARISRSYLVRNFEDWEGEYPEGWEDMSLGDQDEYIIANWTLVGETQDGVDDWQLDLTEA